MPNRFGNDFLLNNGDIVTSPSGDFFTADDFERVSPDGTQFEGQFAIVYSITNKLLTNKGDSPFHPEYGSELPNLISTPNSPNLRVQIRNVIESALMEDDRVQSVANIAVEQRDRFISAKAEVVLIGTDSVSELVFPNFYIE